MKKVSALLNLLSSLGLGWAFAAHFFLELSCPKIGFVVAVGVIAYVICYVVYIIGQCVLKSTPEGTKKTPTDED